MPRGRKKKVVDTPATEPPIVHIETPEQPETVVQQVEQEIQEVVGIEKPPQSNMSDYLEKVIDFYQKKNLNAHSI